MSDKPIPVWTACLQLALETHPAALNSLFLNPDQDSGQLVNYWRVEVDLSHSGAGGIVDTFL